MRRKATVGRIDREIFARSASHSKSINLGAFVFRGGTRL